MGRLGILLKFYPCYVLFVPNIAYLYFSFLQRITESLLVLYLTYSDILRLKIFLSFSKKPNVILTMGSRVKIHLDYESDDPNTELYC